MITYWFKLPKVSRSSTQHLNFEKLPLREALAAEGFVLTEKAGALGVTVTLPEDVDPRRGLVRAKTRVGCIMLTLALDDAAAHLRKVTPDDITAVRNVLAAAVPQRTPTEGDA